MAMKKNGRNDRFESRPWVVIFSFLPFFHCYYDFEIMPFLALLTGPCSGQSGDCTAEETAANAPLSSDD